MMETGRQVRQVFSHSCNKGEDEKLEGNAGDTNDLSTRLPVSPLEYFIRVGWEQNRAAHPLASQTQLFGHFVNDYCSDYVPHSEFIELLATYGITP